MQLNIKSFSITKTLSFPDYRKTDHVTRKPGNYKVQKPVAPAIERWKILYHGFVRAKNVGD